MRKTNLTLVILISVLFTYQALAQQPSGTHNEEYYLYNGSHPDNGTPSWADDIAHTNTFHCIEDPNQLCNCSGNVMECIDPIGCNDVIQFTHRCVRDVVSGSGTQGIAHDAHNWYITTQFVLWKIPVGINLNRDDLAQVSSVKRIELSRIDELYSLGYHHFGDLDHFKYKSKDYLFIPLTGGNSGYGPAVAVFDCNTLDYITFAELPQNNDGGGWCAISPADSCLYASVNHPGLIYQYKIDWEELKNNDTLIFTEIDQHNLSNISGGTQLHHMQGGEFTPNGNLLYVTCGILRCDICIIPTPFGCLLSACDFLETLGLFDCGEQWPTDGLHVFQTSNWQEIKRATNGSGCFNYEVHNDCDLQEPEGLTIWDLDEVPGHHPNVNGQLHVIAFNHQALSEDKVYLKHYSTVKVDAGPDIIAECTSPTTTPVQLSCITNVDDNVICNKPLTFLWSAPGIVFDDPTSQTTIGHFPKGPTLPATAVTIKVTYGPSQSTDTVKVRIVDTTPPVIVMKTNNINLWPPNHKYQTITADDRIESVTDICDEVPVVTVLSVASDEPENGNGDGNTVNDAVITCPNYVKLRAEREGNGNGRVYSITYAATDDWGNQSTAVSKIFVSHEKNGNLAIEGPGPGYVANGPCVSLRESLDETEDGFFSIYPNPAVSQVTLSFGKGTQCAVQLCNMIGEVLFQTMTTTGQVKIDMNDFPKGMYYVTLTDEEGNQIMNKVVKM